VSTSPVMQLESAFEESRVDVIEGETVVTEFHLGPAAIWERLGGFAPQLPFARALPIARHEYRLPWSTLDLSDPEHPRVLERRVNLRRTSLEDTT
jgi:hypothetical protein